MIRHLRTCLVLLLLPAAAAAQSIRGVVRDDSTGRPIESASVTLLDDKGRPVDHIPVRTDSAGRFILHVGKQGKARVQVIRIGYQPVTSSAVDLGMGAIVDLELRMSSVAQRVSDVRIVERRHLTRDELMSPLGFDLRQSRGSLGHFLDTTALKKFGAEPVSAVLADRGTSFDLRFDRDRASGADVLQILNGLRACYPEVWIDGMFVAGGGQTATIQAFSNAEALHRLTALGADEIYGIEVYRQKQLPSPSLGGEIGTRALDPHRACGAIAVWTKRYAAHVAEQQKPPPRSR